MPDISEDSRIAVTDCRIKLTDRIPRRIAKLFIVCVNRTWIIFNDRWYGILFRGVRLRAAVVLYMHSLFLRTVEWIAWMCSYFQQREVLSFAKLVRCMFYSHRRVLAIELWNARERGEKEKRACRSVSPENKFPEWERAFRSAGTGIRHGRSSLKSF